MKNIKISTIDESEKQIASDMPDEFWEHLAQFLETHDAGVISILKADIIGRIENQQSFIHAMMLR